MRTALKMSELTLALLKRRRPRRARAWHGRIRKITALLVAEYGTPSLGNFADPIKEIFYIVLSARTTEPLYKNAHRRLWRRFRTLSAIADAPLRELHDCIGNAGLGKKRSMQIQRTARKLIKDFGSRPGSRLRQLSADEVYAYLLTLPGIGPKSAFCVMMYSLGFDVFPVDAHARRILSRIGLPLRGSKHYHAQAQLPAFVPVGGSKALHVALIAHGRNTCISRTPMCQECKIAHLCSTGSFRAQ